MQAMETIGAVATPYRRFAKGSTGPSFDFFLVAFEHIEGTATDGTDAQQADLNWFHKNFRWKE